MAETEKRSKSSSTLLTVIIAFVANVLVAAAKSVAAVLSGSASMAAEAAHSWADTGNQVFLFFAERRSARPRDKSHPMGYGREAYVWSMFAAFGLFTAGAVVSIMHGIQEIIAPEPAADFMVAYVVLAAAFVFEGISFIQAFRQTRKAAHELDRHTLEQVLISSDPTLRAVFAEDAAALVGLVVAFVGVFLHQVTGSALPDALGSIIVGVLLAVPGGSGRNPGHRRIHGPADPRTPGHCPPHLPPPGVRWPPQAVPCCGGGPAGRPPGTRSSRGPAQDRTRTGGPRNG